MPRSPGLHREQVLNEARSNLYAPLGAAPSNLSQQDIVALPQGTNAPLNEVVLQLPGVTKDTAASGNFHVRNEHANVQYRINGIMLPEGLSGFGQVLDTSLIGNLALIAFAIALAHKLGVSNVPFLILIGMAVGPHAPQLGVFDFRFIETQSLIAFMGRMGVLFLLFYLGLESNVTRLIEAGRSILAGGSLYVGLNFTIGFTYGYLAGFPLRETLIIAGLTTVSSSAIVAFS